MPSGLGSSRYASPFASSSSSVTSPMGWYWSGTASSYCAWIIDGPTPSTRPSTLSTAPGSVIRAGFLQVQRDIGFQVADHARGELEMRLHLRARAAFASAGHLPGYAQRAHNAQVVGVLLLEIRQRQRRLTLGRQQRIHGGVIIRSPGRQVTRRGIEADVG